MIETEIYNVTASHTGQFIKAMRYMLSIKGLSLLTTLAMLLSGSMAFGQEKGAEIRLQSSLQTSQIRQGEVMSVTATMVKAQMVINSPEVVRYLKMSAYIKQPDGSSFLKALFDNGMDGDARAGDGIYSCRFTAAQAGDYAVSVLAEGKGIRLTQEHVFMALPSGKPALVPPEGVPGQIEDIKARAEVRHDVKDVPEKTDKTPQKFPWVIFGVINLIAATVWIIGFGVLFLRLRRQGPIGGKKLVDLGKFIRDQAEEKMKQLASDEKKGQEGATADSKVITELQSARLLFLKGLTADPKKAGEGMDLLWNKIYRSFDEALKLVLKGKKTALEEIDSLHEKVEEIGSISEELKGAQALAEAQAGKIAFLMSFKEVIAESQQKFDSLKKKNKDLEKKLFDAAHEAGVGDAMKAPLAEFKENYKQLELCVATLEQENDRLVVEVGKWHKEFEWLKKQGPVTISETPAEVLKENEDLREMVRELETAIKAKEKELEDLQHTFSSLESEYMVLYQEKQAAQQQPDI